MTSAARDPGTSRHKWAHRFRVLFQLKYRRGTRSRSLYRFGRRTQGSRKRVRRPISVTRRISIRRLRLMASAPSNFGKSRCLLFRATTGLLQVSRAPNRRFLADVSLCICTYVSLTEIPRRSLQPARICPSCFSRNFSNPPTAPTRVSLIDLAVLKIRKCQDKNALVPSSVRSRRDARRAAFAPLSRYFSPNESRYVILARARAEN